MLSAGSPLQDCTSYASKAETESNLERHKHLYKDEDMAGVDASLLDLPMCV